MAEAADGEDRASEKSTVLAGAVPVLCFPTSG